MASLVYTSYFDDLSRGNVNPATDTYKVMLVTSAYVADKNAHSRRSNVTSEVTGTGYTAGGAATGAPTITKDTTNSRVDVAFPAVSWPSSTITARGAVYYKSRGGANTADELVCYVDFVSDVISSNGTFTMGATTVRIQN